MTDTASYSGPLWHVCYVEPQTESAVAKGIDDTLGYPVFLPFERSWRVRRGVKLPMAHPLFIGYVFAAVDPHRQEWQELLDIDGVVDVLGRPPIDRGGIPAHVPAAWVEAMRKAEECGVFDRTKPTPDRFKIGDAVTVSDGPFAGLQAEIVGFMAKMKSATAKKRAKLLGQFMGRIMKIEVDVTALEKA